MMIGEPNTIGWTARMNPSEDRRYEESESMEISDDEQDIPMEGVHAFDRGEGVSTQSAPQAIDNSIIYCCRRQQCYSTCRHATVQPPLLQLTTRRHWNSAADSRHWNSAAAGPHWNSNAANYSNRLLLQYLLQ
ncbi:hypothetical protein ACLOJK_004272 [Asimina triloba]